MPPKTLLDLRRLLLAFCEEHVPEGETVVALGVSGGADSVALLRAVALAKERLPWRPLAIHVDHGARPNSSEDAAFVREACEALGIECVVAVRRAGEGASEETLRELRYEAFAEAMRGAGARCLLLAHHLDDQAETVLHRALRGSGPEGLAGMAERSERGGLVLLRPFLGVRGEALRGALSREGVAWREDASNLDEGFARNRLRHSLLPLAEREINPRAAESLAGLARQFAEDRAYWEGLLAERLADEPWYPDGLRAKALADDPPAVRSRLLARWLADLAEFAPEPRKQPGRVHVEALAGFLATAKDADRLRTANGFRIRREGEWLRALAPGQDCPPLDMPEGVVLGDRLRFVPRRGSVALPGGRLLSGAPWGGGTVVSEVVSAEEAARISLASPWTLCAPFTTTFGPHVRRRRDGDLALSGRKLKELLREAGVPLHQRDYLPVVLDMAKFAWLVPGVWRASPAFEGLGGSEPWLRIEFS